MPPITAIVALVTSVVSRIWPDKTEQGRLQEEILKQQLAAELEVELSNNDLLKGQLDINVEEAKSDNWFVSGARPSIMWICAAIFGWTYLLQPMITYFVVLAGHPAPVLPTLANADVMNVTMGLLGLAGMRSWEKNKGVARS